MKKVILVNASPQRNGNCVKAINIIRENAGGSEIEIFDLNEKQVKPCLGCRACKPKEKVQCVLKDDMGGLLARIDVCDAMVVASPIYFEMVTGSAKLFLDRIYAFMTRGTPKTKSGKKLGIVLTAGYGPLDVYKKHGEVYGSHFDVAGFTERKVLAFSSLEAGPKVNIFSLEENANKIKELAAWICE